MHRDAPKSGFFDLPTEEQIASFCPDDGPCCTENRFQVDITGVPKSAWNMSATAVFVQSFVAAHPEYKKKGTAVRDAWTTHFARLKEIYNEQQRGGGNTVKKVKHRRRERKLQIYYRRLRVAKHYEGLQESVEHVIRELGVDGMSSDESDHESGRGEATYYIVRKPWRTAKLTAYLHVLDALHLKMRYGGEWDKSSGSWPHYRTSSLRDSQRPPPTHLPRNFYSDEWYYSRTSFAQNALYASSVLYNFSHPKQILR
ncbi:hypothetical protein BJ138DRAFT_1018563 [Hygrophoropsis aurantiaca]|uniref:Uncharacterized protein n=1 Tax=Hygrophoropsis aurantiaca TaxID=72124 RepID=A0ACB7ZUE9_9AGAM|nr:hypothetical protein BJ138DRAFT_1018563 [Hygrophoropsis aurantiaca]